MLIKDIREKEFFWIIKELSKSAKHIEDTIVSYSDRITQAEYDLSIAFLKKIDEDLEKFSKIDIELDWGQERNLQEKSNSSYVKKIGDFNPWYQGDLTLEELISSLSKLSEFLESFSNLLLEEIEFLHFYKSLEDFYNLKVKKDNKNSKKSIRKKIVKRNFKHRKYQENSFLDKFLWKFIVPILVLIIAGILLYRFGIK